MLLSTIEDVKIPKEDYASAINDFSRCLKLNPNYSYALNNTASCYIGLEEWEKAISFANKAIEINPNYTYAFYNRAIAKEMLRDLDGACSVGKKHMNLV